VIRLAADDYSKLLPRYLAEPAFFPLIAAVLERSQDGAVWVDDAMQPRQAYVEHGFGFAQIFGEPAVAFETELEAWFSARHNFSVEKVRLYTPRLPAFLQTPAFSGYRSERQRFTLAQQKPSGADVVKPSPIGMQDVAEIEARFGIVSRFWRNPGQFAAASQANVVRHAGNIVAICYAAAIGGGKAEIDVVTDPAFRRQGLGRQAVAGFMTTCAAVGLEPVWDCFTNNIPSVRTAQSLGFSPPGAPYDFFTIPRRSPDGTNESMSSSAATFASSGTVCGPAR
jgi:GNAT superfamily N-acetyltransferase